MFNVNLEWKEFNINCSDVETWLEANIETEFSISANSCLQIHFLSEPSQEEKDTIQAYWDGLTSESDEAVNYVSKEDLETERLAKVASAKAKLAALGLTEDEIKAILG